jgi:hypothetical protein
MSAFRVYWRAYGGWYALIVSPYALFSGVFWAFCKPIWYDQVETGFPWSDWGLSLLSSLLAFSLGALAIFLAFSSEKFLALIRQNGKPTSYFMSVVAAIFHFIIVQFVAISSIILLIAYETVFFSGLSFYLFCYAMACGIAAAAALVDTADILNALGALDDDEPDEPDAHR